MKDKKIIIDDINVSECKCYNPNIKMDCLLYPLQSDACKNNPNCHYKLYKRKEQELNKAKQIILQAVDDFSLEYGTPYYDKLLESAKSLGIEVKDYE